MSGFFDPFGNSSGGGGSASSKDEVARAEIAAIKDGENLDSFSDVETALDNKANITDILSLDANKLDKTGTAVKAIADSDGNNIITTYAKKTDLDDIACTYRGTYTTIETLNAATGDENDYAFYKHTDTNGNTVLDKYIFIPTEQADLPEGYTQLLYIESNGTQYIDTGINPNRDTKFYLKFSPVEYHYGTYYFGTYGLSDRGYYDKFSLSADNAMVNLQVIGGDNFIDISVGDIAEISVEYPYYSVDGTTLTLSTVDAVTFSGTNTICLFTAKRDGSISTAFNSYMRLYACQIYENDGTTLAADYIPCKNASNVLGLYDLVNEIFLPNQGSDTFIAGPQANGYWNFEYSIPGNLFSSTQFAALNSGINTTKVNQIETNKNNIINIKDGTNIDSFSDVEAALSDKVNKETGKGLSTNDYTTTEKEKLAGIAEGAEVNEIESIKVNNTTINPDANKVVNITVPTTAADVSALPDTTKYAAALSLTIDSATFVVTGQLKDQNGDNLGTAQTIDLPLESVVVGGSYNSQTKKVVLTLQNGNTIEFSVADLVSGLQTELSASNKLNPAYINYDSTHRAVSDTEKSTWNGKQNAIDSSHKLSADLVDDTNATNKFATAEELKQIKTNKNNISSNWGAKNLLVNRGSLRRISAENDITYTWVNGDVSVTGKKESESEADIGVIPVTPLSDLGLSDKVVISNNGTKCFLGVIFWSETLGPSSIYEIVSGSNIIDIPSGYTHIMARLGVKEGVRGTINETIQPMICTKAQWDISHEYQPYPFSNAELTAAIGNINTVLEEVL